MSPFKFDPASGELPVGWHDVEIVDAVPGVNAKGNPNLRIVYQAPDGRQITDWLVAVPAARWRWQMLWSAAGLTFPDDGGTVEETDLIGKRVSVEILEDEYQGVVRNKVGDISPSAFDVASDVPSDFDTAATGSAPAAADVDDIPF